MDNLTRKSFAQITASVARVSASWTTDILSLPPEAMGRDANKDSIARFRQDIQDFLDLLPK